MSLYLGYLSLGMAFVILASILLWNGFRLRSFRVSLAMVPLVVWYSMALFYVPSHLMGWPSNNKIPEKFIVISSWVHEPMKGQKGGIYFWGFEWDGKKPDRNLTTPKDAFRYIPESMSTPRAFRVGYSLGLHKKLMKQQEEVEQVAGGFMMIKRSEKRIAEQEDEEQIGPESDLEFTILNPAEVQTK